MLGRAPALALSDTSAHRGLDLLPESVIAQRVIIGKTFADVMNVDLRDLSSKEFPIGALPIVLARPQPDIQIVVTQERIGFAPGMPAIGRPAVLLRRLHHARRHGVQFYVAHAGKEILVRLHQARLMAPFPQRTAAPVLAVDVQNIMPSEVLHEP